MSRQHIARATAGQVSSRFHGSTLPSPYAHPIDRSPTYEGSVAEYDNTLPETLPNSIGSTSSASLQAFPNDLRDVVAVQSRAADVLDALQTSDHMTPAQLSLIKTVRETASDPDIMSKIINNGSFQEFMMHVPSLLGEQRLQIGGGSPLGTQGTVVIDDYDSENEFFGSARRSSFSSNSSTSTTSSASYSSEHNNYENYSSSSDEETSFLRRRSRRVLPNDADPNSIAQQRALHRLDELCHQISPGFTQSSSVKGSATPPSSDFCETPELDASKPTMEGPGIPGVPKAVPESPPPAEPWANPVYLFVVTACVIPITILAVTAAVYPSPKTWGLLRSGFKAICNKILS